MALNDSQISDILENYIRHSPDHLLKAAITRMREWKASAIHYKQQVGDLHRENAELREKLREALDGNS